MRVTFSLSGIFQLALEVEQVPEALDPKHDDRVGRARLEADAPGAALPDAHGSSEGVLGGDLAVRALLRLEEGFDGRNAPVSFRVVALDSFNGSYLTSVNEKSPRRIRMSQDSYESRSGPVVAASPRPPAGPQRHRNLVPSPFVRESLGCFPAFSEARNKPWTVYARPKNLTANGCASGVRH